MPTKAVLDTNVLVSSLIATQGTPRRLFNAWQANQFTLITSPYLLAELQHVLTYPRIAKRLSMHEAELATILAALAEKAEFVRVTDELSGVTRDPKDDQVIACAVAGKADYIVSGDQDILVIGIYKTIRIVTPVEFVQVLERGTADI
jgi:hypothetical protein